MPVNIVLLFTRILLKRNKIHVKPVNNQNVFMGHKNELTKTIDGSKKQYKKRRRNKRRETLGRC